MLAGSRALRFFPVPLGLSANQLSFPTPYAAVCPLLKSDNSDS